MNLKGRLIGSIVLALATALAGAQGTDAPQRGVERELGGDRFAAGPNVRVESATPGDLIAAAGQLELSAPVSGDAVIIGGEVRTTAAVAMNTYAAGGRLRLAGEMGRNLRAAGGQVEIGPEGRVAGNASVAGGEVTLRAPISGSLQVAGGRVLIDAAIGGDVDAVGGQIELGPQARIGGALRWRSGSELERHPAAQVTGKVERLTLPMVHRDRAERERGTRWGAVVAWIVGTTLGLSLLAAAALAALPGATAGMAKTLVERKGMSVLIGFVTLVCTPVALLILCVTIVGVPIAVIVLLAYLAALLLAYVAAAVTLGLWGLQRWRAEAAAHTGWRIVATALALLAMALVGQVPWVGGLIVFVLVLGGLGAIVLQLRRPAPGAPAATSAAAAAAAI